MAYLKGALSNTIRVTPIVPFLYEPKNQRFAVGLVKRAAKQLWSSTAMTKTRRKTTSDFPPVSLEELWEGINWSSQQKITLSLYDCLIVVRNFTQLAYSYFTYNPWWSSNMAESTFIMARQPPA